MDRTLRVTGALVTSIVWLTLSFGSAAAESPSPSAAGSPRPSGSPSASGSPVVSSEVTITARPLLGGHVRPGAWAAVEAEVSNSGPAVSGELRIRGPREGRSQYGVQVELPTNARQRYTLYAQTAFFGRSVSVDFVAEEQTLATQAIEIRSHDASGPIVAVVAERPEGLLSHVNDAMVNPNVAQTTVIALQPGDLPARVEAWTAIDRLVWQDANASDLSEAQLEALKLWLGAGGRLTIVGGTTGFGPLQAFGDILPYTPDHTVDAQTTDVTPLLGTIPSGATALPALAGTLTRGSILARSGDDVIAAEAGHGRGVVTLIGFNPATPWIAASSGASEQLWRRLMPQTSGPALNPLSLPDDSQIVFALQNLPAVDLPPIEQLFVLLIAYIALVGPINYFVLRRLDKREWAWVTIPALVAVFAVGSYGLGATLKGSDVIVNEIAVVRAAQGSDRGIGQVYIGIYSPSRRTFDVRVPGGALLSNPTSQAQQGQTETPLDVVFGESASRLRNFEVGFGVLRGFRAEAPANAPMIEANLRLANGQLTGTVTNRSDTPLENVAVVYAGGVETLAELGAGQSTEVTIDVTGPTNVNYALSEQIFGSTFPRDQVQARKFQTRRAVIEQLFPYGSASGADAPMLLAWRNGPVLDVELPGDSPNRVGEGLFMVPLSMGLDAQQIFTDQAMRRTVVESTAAQGWADAGTMYLTRGTMVVEVAPARFDGVFTATSLEIAITQGDVRVLRGTGQPAAPLPEDQQPDQADPLSEPGPAVPDASPSPAPTEGGGKPGGVPVPDFGPATLPAYQLYDLVAQRWVEFEQPVVTKSYLIQNPERYVDGSGRVQFRFVNRNEAGQFGEEQAYFQLAIRIEGSIQ